MNEIERVAKVIEEDIVVGCCTPPRYSGRDRPAEIHAGAGSMKDKAEINATLLAHLEWSAKFLQPLIGGSAQYEAILATIAIARGE